MKLVGVVPAAGYARRLQPLSGSKEVYPVDGRPVMDYVVDRMRAADCDELRVVTRPDKEDVIANANRHGATVVLGTPKSLSASIALGVAGLAGADVVLLGFPDTVWRAPAAFEPLVSALEGHEAALGLFPTAEPETCDTVTCDAEGRVTAIEVKAPEPASDLLWGCAALRARALEGIAGEADPGYRLAALARAGAVAGVRLPGSFVDIGKSRERLPAL